MRKEHTKLFRCLNTNTGPKKAPAHSPLEDAVSLPNSSLVSDLHVGSEQHAVYGAGHAEVIRLHTPPPPQALITPNSARTVT